MTMPDELADPFLLDWKAEFASEFAGLEPQPIVTGLSDEVDARRHLDRQFGGPRGFCRNCEVEYSVVGALAGAWCPVCFDPLAKPGTAPRRRKYNP